MISYQHENYDDYCLAQSSANKRKRKIVWATKEEILFLSEFININCDNPEFGLCHGVRNGFEVEQFRFNLGIDVIGTDISESANKFKNVIQWDFHNMKDEWTNKFDFIYTNSLDHSYDPEKCIDVWMKCLKKDGFCIIQWTRSHDGNYATPSDCFKAGLEEYKQIVGIHRLYRILYNSAGLLRAEETYHLVLRNQ